MYTFEQMLAVTSRKLCTRPFLEQVKWLAGMHPLGIILREKDLTEKEYEELAVQVKGICRENGTECILHSWVGVARRLNCPCIHLPFERFQREAQDIQDFQKIGVSVHSVGEAVRAQELGASYVTAGHIFPTDCKKGMPARGLGFLREVCEAVAIPVFAIGGITPQNATNVCKAGASGYCVMSGVMR